ncbi:hypothetical protein GOP47_0010550 [Adiantum capillus-veneris]|uniref:Uncharacterized protein n=1 Tax=Adiantum capillus-veneris TaxID=13818 RepID=A0A9D4ZGH8_ADICA|nr:hypothetical protein GOP47_0010550 [Adiantum capillus-veneris]
MLGQLSSLRRRGQRLIQGFFFRGITTQNQGRRHQPGPHPRHQPAPHPPPVPPEKIEWWAVDGELFKAEKFDPKRVLAPLEHEHISNRRRRKDLVWHLRKTRLKLRIQNQDSYWEAYIKRFQILRDEWEKHVWDPPPVPQPKRRNPAWLAEETEKYVWCDPRREAYVTSREATQNPSGSAYTFDLSRMDQSAVRAKFDEKIGYTRQAMSHSPYENRRNPGASGARPDMTQLKLRNADFPRCNIRPTEVENFDDVFENEDDSQDDDEDTSKSHAHAKAALSNTKAALSTTEDDDGPGGELFSWGESDSEGGAGDEVEAAGKDVDEDEDDDSVDEFKMEDFEPKKKGWFGEEDDLFKDDE